ncbi:hypothetical protein HPB49_022337 [Dermacentor silvarum]|uniref:Uncharacterized protein n=1 Tax=Dermacentor silvarum TaxID=543639 RepID=A0ACB8CTI0_DERSI|nr:hypothetical protein HPB49_022337 [Dermacentor silvarum]
MVDNYLDLEYCGKKLSRLGSYTIITFYQKASAFEESIGISSCDHCSPRRFYWSDVQGGCLCIAYCIAGMLVNPPESNGYDSALMQTYYCSKHIIRMIFYFVYDSVNTAALWSSSQVLSAYIGDKLFVLKGRIESQATRFGCRTGDAQRVQAVRLNLATELELKEEINIWRWPLVISSLCVLLLPCMSVHEGSRPGFITEER